MSDEQFQEELLRTLAEIHGELQSLGGEVGSLYSAISTIDSSLDEILKAVKAVRRNTQ